MNGNIIHNFSFHIAVLRTASECSYIHIYYIQFRCFLFNDVLHHNLLCYLEVIVSSQS